RADLDRDRADGRAFVPELGALRDLARAVHARGARGRASVPRRAEPAARALARDPDRQLVRLPRGAALGGLAREGVRVLSQRVGRADDRDLPARVLRAPAPASADRAHEPRTPRAP